MDAVIEEGRREPRCAGFGWPIALTLLALALNAYFYSGFYMSDDISYLDGIQRLAAGEKLEAANIAHTRLALIFPAAFVYWLSGSLTLTIASFCLYHPVVVGLTVLAGRVAFGRRAAVLSAAMVTLAPVYYFYGGAVLPDNGLSMWLALLLLLVLVTVKEGASGKLSRRRELCLWATAGVLTGIAYSAKEPGLIMAVPVAGAIALSCVPRWGWRWSWVAVGGYGLALALMLVIEALVLRATTGEWTFRLVSGVGNAENVEALLERVNRQGRWPLQRLHFLATRLTPFFLPFGLLLMIGANAAALFLFRGAARRFTLVAIGFSLWPLLYLTLGTTNFTRYLPPPIQHARYYAICVIPALLVTGAVMAHLSDLALRRFSSRRVAWVVALAPAIVIGLWGAALFVKHEPQAGTAYRALQAKSALAAFKDARLLYPKTPVVLSSYLSRRLAPLLRAHDCKKCPPIVTEVKAPEAVPERPFLVMMAAKEYKDSLGPTLDKMRKTRALHFRRVGHSPYRAPLGRRSELLAGLYPLFSDLTEPSWPVTIQRRSIELFLVTDPKAPKVPD